MAIITELVQTHQYRNVGQTTPDPVFTATLSARVDDVTRLVSALIVTNPGPRAVLVVVFGPLHQNRADAAADFTIPAGTASAQQNIPAGRRFTLKYPVVDGEIVPEWQVSMSEF